jgi:hypothetical protein
MVPVAPTRTVRTVRDAPVRVSAVPVRSPEPSMGSRRQRRAERAEQHRRGKRQRHMQQLTKKLIPTHMGLRSSQERFGESAG